MQHGVTGHSSPEMQECIQNCSDCHRSCLALVPHCLQLGGEHADPNHIRLLLDCAQICQTSADFMIRGSQSHPQVCGVCADVCTRCAQDCERMAGDDAMMRECAEICRRCAASCQQMAGMAA
jgi:hypothetical protein